MNGRLFYGLLGAMIIGFFAVAIISKEPAKPRPGSAHSDNGRKHVSAKEYGSDEPPTSGDHAEALPWQVYDREVPDVNVIHNLEHGGVYVSYRPDIAKSDIEKLKGLFSRPYSNASFTPNKAIVAPRTTNKPPIVLSSWTRSLALESFDETTIIEYYLANVGKSPEPLAR